MPTNINVASVRAWADIDGTNLSVTDYRVERSAQESAGTATITGIVDDVSEIELRDTVRVYIEYETDDVRYEARLFTGDLEEATQNEENKVEITAYDMLRYLHDYRVKINPEEPRYASDVAADLLRNAGITVSRDPNETVATPNTAYVAPRSAFPKEDNRANRQYGSGKNGEQLTKVLSKIASKLGGYMWVDKNNVFRIEPYPTHKFHRAQYVLKMGAGDQNETRERTVVKGGNASDSGFVFDQIYGEQMPTSTANNPNVISSLDSSDESTSSRTRTITDQNVSTQIEADRYAATEQTKTEVSREAGELTITGNPLVRVFDRIYVPNFGETTSETDRLDPDRFTITGSDTIFDPEPDAIEERSLFGQDVAAGTYTITAVRHEINNNNGYRTILSLSPDARASASGVSGASDAIGNLLAQDITESELDVGPLEPFDVSANDPDNIGNITDSD